MSLERCESCAKSISEEAVICPQCGHPLDEGWAQKIREARMARSNHQQKVALIIAPILSICVVALVLLNWNVIDILMGTYFPFWSPRNVFTTPL